MRSIFFGVLSGLLSLFSASQTGPKLCIDCKFYRRPFFSSTDFGKCSAFIKEYHDDYFLINGVSSSKKTDYYFCSTSRNFEDMCGEEGRCYEQKPPGLIGFLKRIKSE
jgi:hypothetical protein